jgi:hypothetical protein
MPTVRCANWELLRGLGVQTVLSGGYGIPAVRAGQSDELAVALRRRCFRCT